MKVKGMNGSLELTPNSVQISRRGAGTKTVPLAAIQGVEFKPGGLTVGYLRIDTGTGIGQKGVLTNKNQLLLRDPNTVTFQWRRNKDMQSFADAVNAALVNA